MTLTWVTNELATMDSEFVWVILGSGPYQLLHRGTNHAVGEFSSLELAKDAAERMESQKEVA
jgi:hypothetical protein